MIQITFEDGSGCYLESCLEAEQEWTQEAS